MKAKSAQLPIHARPPAEELPISVRDPRLTQVAYERILKAIVYGRLDLGEPLSENDLAKALGVSKAPVRQSLNELRMKGLVVVIPQSGSYVFSPPAKRLRNYAIFAFCWRSGPCGFRWSTMLGPY